MSLQALLASKRLERHLTSPNELAGLRKLVARDIADAGVPASRQTAPLLPPIMQSSSFPSWRSLVPAIGSPPQFRATTKRHSKWLASCSGPLAAISRIISRLAGAKETSSIMTPLTWYLNRKPPNWPLGRLNTIR